MPGISKSTFRRISLTTKFAERNPRNVAPGIRPGARGIREDRWFYTTGPMATATKSGADVNTAKLTPGTAQARICIWSGGAYIPDTSDGAVDQTIYNFVVISASVPAGCYYKCTIVNGMWESDLSSQC